MMPIEWPLWGLVAALAGAAMVGVLIGMLVAARRQRLNEQRILSMQEQLSQAQAELANSEGRLAYLPQLEERKQQLESRLEESREAYSQLNADMQAVKASHQEGLKHAAEKLELLEKSEKRLQQEFENLANRIFEQKSQRLQESSKLSLESTLAPFKQQIEAFKTQVQQQFTDETKQRSLLQSELMTLKQLNQQMTAEAEALTRALKGDSKQQGNWGEVVLERMLQQSGLREGHEYETQSQHRDEDGKAFKPDVIVHLPNDKDVVIDSKVSLVAYERYFNGDDDDLRKRSLDEHVNSLRQHIKQLGKKNYQQLESVRTLDYVLMFIPIEPAFLLAVDRDPELIKLALDNQIMLVSPTNLLVALRTIHNIWQYEYQSQNAQRIASDAGKLYDKFWGFLEDMNKMGNAIDSVKKNFDGAMNKLSSGRGNIVGRVEKFRDMGVQTTKKIDPKLLDNNSDSDDDDSSEPSPAIFKQSEKGSD